MIQVLYRGGLGENLFQYCFGRIMAERWGHALKADPVPHFPNTAEPVFGKRFISPHQSWSGSAVEERQLGILLRDQELSIPYEGRLILFGWFQRWEFYQTHQDKIRQWLQTTPCAEPADSEDIAVCLRHDRPLSWAEPGIHAGHSPMWRDRTIPLLKDVSSLLERTPHKKVLVFTDRPFTDLGPLSKFDTVVRYADTFASWNLLKSCNRIVTSVCHPSDFWAAWLSSAKQIFAVDPWPQSVASPCGGPYGCGWSNSRPLARPNLHVVEERWTYDW